MEGPRKVVAATARLRGNGLTAHVERPHLLGALVFEKWGKRGRKEEQNEWQGEKQEHGHYQTRHQSKRKTQTMVLRGVVVCAFERLLGLGDLLLEASNRPVPGP